MDTKDHYYSFEQNELLQRLRTFVERSLPFYYETARLYYTFLRTTHALSCTTGLMRALVYVKKEKTKRNWTFFPCRLSKFDFPKALRE